MVYLFKSNDNYLYWMTRCDIFQYLYYVYYSQINDKTNICNAYEHSIDNIKCNESEKEMKETVSFQHCKKKRNSTHLFGFGIWIVLSFEINQFAFNTIGI